MMIIKLRLFLRN
uniref:Uncharacterized protein n=1 Tax=Arundo donax TaxID=35708 RepID=A0A0A8ZXZ6_ARUDO